MTKLPLNNDREKQATDEAWARLQATLAGEAINPRWNEWGLTSDKEEGGPVISMKSEITVGEMPQEERATYSDSSSHNNVPLRRWKMTRRSKWAAAVAGVAALAVVLATPVGNTAMASLLNQFRMETVTAVNEDDLRNMFYQLTDRDNIHEAVNDFGSFQSTPGMVSGDMSPAQIQESLGYSPLSAALRSNHGQLFVSSSQEIKLSLKVEKTNEVMKRLGAVKLLPESVDGKPITLHIPEIVNYNLAENKNDWASLQQMKTPVLTVDPSIKVEEALEAVLNFPLLPESLKSSLQQTGILSGEIPMPVFVNDSSEQVQVAGVTVMLQTTDMGKDYKNYSAIWVKDGQLFNFNGGNTFNSKEKLMAKLQELIQS
ncbi:hypothetical protein ACFRAM_00495 [Paenibacillus sp. NPDC056722]|uniref:hypothetical protein n=1 Tax=Paenibacillus sp. NPDC056722 TaxID=3345924 RepID=UPI0036C13930